MGKSDDKAGGFRFDVNFGGKDKRPGGVGGLLGGLSDLLEQVQKFAEEHGSQGGGAHTTGDGKATIHYGVSIRSSGDGQPVSVEPFGNVKRDDKTGKAVVREVREPMCDVFDESDVVVVVAEMPGVDAADVQASAEGDILTISAVRGELRYHKELLLPAAVVPDSLSVTANMGVIEIRASRAAGGDS